MTETLTFLLPNGGQAFVTIAQAKEIAARLWDRALDPGAAPAATRISDALRNPPVLREPVQFAAREAPAVVRAADGSVTWTPKL